MKKLLLKLKILHDFPYTPSGLQVILEIPQKVFMGQVIWNNWIVQLKRGFCSLHAATEISES
uniref:Uncharacterized protein n=1 Tax=Manihot esculenta TaxID=3983 RepID=A0A2C9VB14_MANES